VTKRLFFSRANTLGETFETLASGASGFLFAERAAPGEPPTYIKFRQTRLLLADGKKMKTIVKAPEHRRVLLAKVLFGGIRRARGHYSGYGT
jgi:hypothetical protein